MMAFNNILKWKPQAWGLIIFFMFSFSLSYSQDKNLNSKDLFILAKREGKSLNFEAAAKYCEQALEQTPLDMDIKEYLGKCYMETGRLQEARIILLDVLNKSPNRVDARHYLLNIETQTKRYSSAVCYANELLEITPYSKTLWMRKISLYQLMNNQVEAERATKRLYHIFPEDEEVKTIYNNLLKYGYDKSYEN
jgi:tetratricopeptide (TPR) repeat protein